MNKLLSFSPEPFTDLDHEAEGFEFESTSGEWEIDEAEEEAGRRRRPRPSRGIPRGLARAASVRRSPKARIAPPPMNLSRTPPRFSKGLRPIPVGRLIPTLPYIPPLVGLRPYPRPAPPRDVPPTDDNRHTEQARSEGSGNPPGTQPSEEPGSEYIRWVQDCLNRALGLQLPVDGIMSRETRSAVRSFQERQGLPITGLVGPETEAVLKSTCAGSLPPANNTEPTPDAEWEAQNRSTGPGPSKIVLGRKLNPVVPPSNIPNYTQCDFIHPNIDVAAQYALYGMLKSDPPSRNASVQMLAAVKTGRLGGIYQEDQGVPGMRGVHLGYGGYVPLISTYRRNASSAACIPPAPHPSHKLEIISFKKSLAKDLAELGGQLRMVWSDCIVSKLQLPIVTPRGGVCTHPAPPQPSIPPNQKIPPVMPQICVSPKVLDFLLTPAHEPQEFVRTLEVRNCGVENVDWYAAPNRSWIKLDRNSGWVMPGSPQSIRVSIDSRISSAEGEIVFTAPLSGKSPPTRVPVKVHTEQWWQPPPALRLCATATMAGAGSSKVLTCSGGTRLQVVIKNTLGVGANGWVIDNLTGHQEPFWVGISGKFIVELRRPLHMISKPWSVTVHLNAGHGIGWYAYA